MNNKLKKMVETSEEIIETITSLIFELGKAKDNSQDWIKPCMVSLSSVQLDRLEERLWAAAYAASTLKHMDYRYRFEINKKKYPTFDPDEDIT